MEDGAFSVLIKKKLVNHIIPPSICVHKAYTHVRSSYITLVGCAVV